MDLAHDDESVEETLSRSVERLHSSRRLLDAIERRLARGASLLGQAGEPRSVSGGSRPDHAASA